MARAMKVFKGSVYMKGDMYHCVLATTTKKKACEILGVSHNELNNYWYCWEENDGLGGKTKPQALASPNTPLYCHDKEYHKQDKVFKKLK